MMFGGSGALGKLVWSRETTGFYRECSGGKKPRHARTWSARAFPIEAFVLSRFLYIESVREHLTVRLPVDDGICARNINARFCLNPPNRSSIIRNARADDRHPAACVGGGAATLRSVHSDCLWQHRLPEVAESVGADRRDLAYRDGGSILPTLVAGPPQYAGESRGREGAAGLPESQHERTGERPGVEFASPALQPCADADRGKLSEICLPFGRIATAAVVLWHGAPGWHPHTGQERLAAIQRVDSGTGYAQGSGQLADSGHPDQSRQEGARPGAGGSVGCGRVLSGHHLREVEYPLSGGLGIAARRGADADESDDTDSRAGIESADGRSEGIPEADEPVVHSDDPGAAKKGRQAQTQGGAAGDEEAQQGDRRTCAKAS